MNEAGVPASEWRVHYKEGKTDFTQTEMQIFNDKLCDKCSEGGIWGQWRCFKAPDLVKILKMSRRWEGEEGREDCGGRKNSRCKDPW